MQKQSIWYKLRKISAVRIIVGSFIFLILLGTFLLSLPISYRGERLSLLDTCFTTTSATCVTGLIIADTAQHWTFFGQAVLLMLIQIGGLGFMALISLFSFVAGRRITLKERVIMSESLSGIEVGGIVRLMRRILYGTLLFEASGAVLLAIVFIPDFGFLQGIWKSIFVSVSAFCNAGFDLMGDKYGAFVSLVPYADNVIVNFTVCGLIIMGGLGFFVWGRPRQKRMSLHTKLVLWTTGVLLISGTVGFFVLERQNPATIGTMPLAQKWLCAFFQSVSTRTAGFNTVSNADLTVAAKFLTMVLMFIGGSPGSTAGGIKTVTALLVFWGTISALRGCADINLLGRRVSKALVFRAMSVTVAALMIAGVSVILLLCFGGGSPINLVFETFSALGTVGLGTGTTPFLPATSKVILIILMFIGRVGIMSLAVAVLLKEEKTDVVRLPEEKVLIG